MYTYPTTPDRTIAIGHRVLSFDFPGYTDSYVSGTVVDFVELEGCTRYKIKVESRVIGGHHVEPAPEFVYPPVNGIAMTFGGATRGVVRKQYQ